MSGGSVGDLDGGVLVASFPGGADGDYAGALAVLGLKLFDEGVVVQSGIPFGGDELGFAGSVDLKHTPFIAGWGALEDDHLDAMAGHQVPGGAADVGFLDASGKGALPTDRQAMSGRHGGAGKDAGSDNQFVIGSKRIAFRIHLVGQYFCNKSTAAEVLDTLLCFFGFESAFVGVDPQYFTHGCLHTPIV
jgi:hypothetical protein